MSKRSIFAKSALAAAASAMAIGAAAGASAQTYSGGGGYASGGYDSCQREANGRGVGGALVGGGLGAVMGSQISASGHRTDGSVLGGLVGALAGAAIGHNTAACRGYAPPARTVYADPTPPPPPPPPAYVQDGYPDGGYYGRHDRYRTVEEQPVGPDGCTLAESPVLMPDGRTQTRFVKVCLDRRGRYQVVD